MSKGVFDKLISFLRPWMDLFSAISESSAGKEKKSKKEENADKKDVLKTERAVKRAALFSDIEISGESEKTQKIRQKSKDVLSEEKKADEAKKRFIAEMHRCENWDEATAESETAKFGYAGMNAEQQREYFRWRTDVRAGNFPDADSVYVRICAQEILNGCGWTQAEDGLKQLVDLWTNYRKRFLQMDAEMFEWTFSFARQHGIDFAPDEYADIPATTPSVIKDLLIDRHRQDKPLKLSFPLVEVLSGYAIRESKFYKEGNQKLVEEALPRAIALADALQLKQDGKGILWKYGPRTGKKQRYSIYADAAHPDADQWVDVTVKPYTASVQLRKYISEVVRHAENVLRSICGSRGRLRVESLDVGTAERIEEFLRKEYGKVRKAESPENKRVEVKLDFDSINALRLQSDAVREALEVVDANEAPVEIPVVQKHETSEKPKEREDGHFFDADKLSGSLRDLIETLSDVQCKVLREILISDGARSRINEIAEEAMSLPEIIIDEINDAATAALDDILIDTFGDAPCVLEQYENELKSAAADGG